MKSSSCTNCSSGFFNDMLSSTFCAQCSPGTFAAFDGMSVCAMCTPGKASNVNLTACDLCIPGTYADMPMSSVCTLCPPGNFADNFNSTVCFNCPQGKFTMGDNGIYLIPEWRLSKSCASLCPAGTFGRWGVGSIAEPCKRCPGGYYNSMGQSGSCASCGYV
jgi:hypothetical protein